MNLRSFSLIFLFVVCRLFVSISAYAQLVDADTLQIQDEVIDEKEVHSPRKATIYSAILPGLGQAYNKKYWKIPLIYAGFGAIVYYIDWNNDNYNFNKTAYQHLVDSDPETNDFEKIEAIQYYDLNNPTHFNNFKDGLKKRQDFYRRNRDLLIIGMVAFYGLNVVDASVDAHLFDFDISDDLTMQWQPSMLNFNKNIIYGVNIRFNL
ncbi:MAG: DUF5683 domain-containing protein [Prolixibacteraceae bacterium]|nr:DUF5683 domain-containing protein [Prolixibacteraceae bacterium]